MKFKINTHKDIIEGVLIKNTSKTNIKKYKQFNSKVDLNTNEILKYNEIQNLQLANNLIDIFV